MSTQQYSNHRQFVPSYHYVLSSVILGCLVISTINLGEKLLHASEGTVDAIFYFLVSLALLGLFWFARVFALRAQDRAIRAEENFRHFILTGKPLPSGLRMNQVIALRFASDAEFPDLAQKAVAEKIPGEDIKKMIVQWRPDFHRV